MLAKPSTQLTMHTHPSAGVFNLLKYALSREEEEEVYVQGWINRNMKYKFHQ